MKTIRNLLLFVGTALFLAACGTGGNGGGDGDQNGTLAIALDGVSSAPVVVSQGSDEVWSGNVATSTTRTLPAGSYTVTGGSVAGYTAPGAQTVDVEAGAETKVTLEYSLVGLTDPDPDQDEPGLYVELYPFAVRNADTSVTVTTYPAGTEVATDDGAGSVVFELEPGQYVVTVNSPGYDTVSREVDHGDADTHVSITLIPTAEEGDDGRPDGDIAAGDVSLSFVDENGHEFETLPERNPSKDVQLLAAQTEDRICVTVRTGVANAVVDVDVTNTARSSVAVFADNCEQGLATSSTNRGLIADANGDVHFTLFSTYQEDSVISEGDREPVKVVVSARGANGRADISEFKVFFVNMSHLLFGHGEVETAPMAVVKAAIDSWIADPSTALNENVYTGQRWGREFEIPANIWGSTPSNAHYFGTGAAQKQPFDFGPFRPDGSDSDAYVHIGFGGYVDYSLVGGDTDLVQWGGDCALTGDGDCRISGDGAFNAQLTPTSAVDLARLPISVDIEVTYYHEVNYGPMATGETAYAFPIKQYSLTKEWVGGYLEIDKEVTQHVLTWYGDDVTLPAQSPTGSFSIPSEYTSTVVITVTNPVEDEDGATLYNVTVADHLPAELGVVISSLADSDGHYDATNHAITWENIDKARALAPGEGFTIEFDVYARQKPGYCWDGGDTTGYRVQPIRAGMEPCAYQDPYLVVNGRESETVSAGAYFTPDTSDSAEQLFYYTPEQDESDIYVVRPLFDITKSLASTTDTIRLNGTVDFDLAVRQINRVSPRLLEDPDNTEYSFLEAMYPWEFDWYTATPNASTGAGFHRAADSEIRNNPYARNVQVVDIFDHGLTFTQGEGFNNELYTPSSPNVEGKRLTFNPITSVSPDGSPVTAEVRLTGSLPSYNFDDPDVPLNGAAASLDDGSPAWQNCVFLNAPQLNQPFYDPELTGQLEPFASTVYGDEFRYSGGLWYRSQIEHGPGDDEFDGPGLVRPDGEGEYERVYGPNLSIYDCELVAVMEVVLLPVLGINVNGEHPDYVNRNNTGNPRDTYVSGEEWHYIYGLNNGLTNTGVAEGVVLTFTQLDPTVTTFGTGGTSVQVWRSNNEGATWTLATTGVAVTTNTAATKVVEIDRVEAAEFISVVIEGIAQPVTLVSTGQVRYEASYDNNTHQPNIDPSFDSTTVQPVPVLP